MSESLEVRHFNGHQLATVWHDAGGRNLVVFCHGFRGTSTGPSRSFVIAARELARSGISSLRFDQCGSGNSEGDFVDSSFDDWVATTVAIVRAYLAEDYKVALFGQSMGAAAAIVVASRVPELAGLVAWVPDPNVDEVVPTHGVMEEGGQLIQVRYWREAKAAAVGEKLKVVTCPAYVVQCTHDEMVNETNRRAIEENVAAHHVVETFEGFTHSSWTYDQFAEVIGKSVDFLVGAFGVTKTQPSRPTQQG